MAGSIGRRELLQLGLLSGAGLVAGCSRLEQKLTQPALPASALPQPGTRRWSPAVRILNRAAYGPRPGDVARVEQIGADAYVEEQLHPPELPADWTGVLEAHAGWEDDDPAVVWRTRSLRDCLSPDTGILFDIDDHRLVAALRQATLLRAIYSRHQLRERMVEFWSDHFNIYAFKGQGPQLKILDDGETIRRHALGRFRELLDASARSAAMLGYLDNNVNRKGVPNENYARELMELHTLGVDGGYTQRDVEEVARCLTGWTAERHWHRGQFLFDPDAHDDGAKSVLGHVILAGGGRSDGDRVLDILARHPSTARHLSRKLCVAFLGHAPDGVVSRLSRMYQATSGDMRSVLRDLLLGPAVHESPPILKRPYDFVVSALRATNADTDGGVGLQAHLERMGQPLFAWPRPDGFPQKPEAWTGTMIPRWTFAMALSAGQIDRTAAGWDSMVDWCKKQGLDLHDSLLELVFGCEAGDPALAPLRALKRDHAEPARFASVALMSPEFQWR